MPSFKSIAMPNFNPSELCDLLNSLKENHDATTTGNYANAVVASVLRQFGVKDEWIEDAKDSNAARVKYGVHFKDLESEPYVSHPNWKSEQTGWVWHRRPVW